MRPGKFPSREFPVREFPGSSRFPGISRGLGISRGTGISRTSGNSRDTGISREIPETREFPRSGNFPPVSRETGNSREFPARGFPLNIAALETRCFLAILLWLLPASALALALALLVPCLWLRAAGFARPTTATACLPVISTHECQVIALSNKLSFMQHCRRSHLHPLSWYIS